MKTIKSKILLFILVVCLSEMGWGQVSITAVGTNFTQNFDGLGTSATASLPAGFKVNPGPDWSTGTTATTLAAGTSGTGALTGSSSGGTYNFANGVTASATDRALGFLNTGSFSVPRSIIYAFTNNSGSTISAVAVSFDYEKYRTGTRAWEWTFFHGSSSSPATSEANGNQSYPSDGSNAVVNPPTTISKSFTISGLNITAGTTYYLRWTSSATGNTNGQGIGIDNFLITAFATSCVPPSAPTVSASQTFPACSTPTIASLTATGSNILWYAASTGGSALSTSTALVNGNTYYASQTVTCESTTRTPSTVSIGSCSLATVTTSSATNITATSATIGADVVSSGSAVTDRGTFYDVNPSPTINGTSQGSGLGSYTRNLTGLAPNTVYYYRGYAVNSSGTATGTDLSFTTLNTVPTGISATPTYKSIIAGWIAPSGGGSAVFTYDVQIDDNADFSSILASVTGLASSITSNNFSTASVPSTPYYVRVRTTNAGGSSAWSSSASASLLASTGTLSSSLAMWVDVWTSTAAASPLTAPFLGANVSSAQVSRVGLTSSGNSARYSSSTWNSLANYLEFTITPATGYALNLNGESIIASMGSSATGPNGYNLYSSIDGYTTSLGTFATLCPSGFATSQLILPSSGFNSLSSITFRIVGVQTGCSSTISSGGTGGFTALTISGSAVPFACTTPSAPTGSATQSFVSCSTPTIASLTANGTNIKWYASASTVGGALATSLALTNGATYYATQNTGCESTTFYQTTVSYPGCSSSYDYTWVGGASGAWTTASNWSPTRTTPSVLDKLTISGNVQISGVPTQTIDALYIANNANVTLSASGTNTLTIGSTAGTDFVVGSGSVLTLASSNVLTITLSTGNKGSVYGTVTTTGAAHKLGASSASDPITFYNGATAGQGGGAMFNGTSTMVFNAGSNFVITNGGNPFTSAVFDPAANYIHWTNNSPSLSNRTYPNLTVKSGVVTSGTGSNPFSVQSLTVESGASFNLGSFSGTVSINGVSAILGNATVVWPSGALTNSSTLSLNPTGSNTIVFPNLVNNGVLNVHGNTLSVSSSFTNSGTINIGEGGSLLQAGTGANSGTYNITRQATNQNDWSFYSSPVSGAPVSNLGNSIYYAFNEAIANSYTNGWYNPSGSMTPGVGYIAFPTRVTFVGTANNGNISVPVSLSAGNATAVGWNLIGNPYPSSLDVPAFLSANSSRVAAVNVWKTTLGTDNYSSINTGSVGSGQSFFVQVASSGSILFTNAMRGNVNASTPFYRSSSSPSIRFRLDNGKDWQETQVGIKPEATDGYDVSYDASLMNGNPNISFYSTLPGRKLAIQELSSDISNEKEVPLYYSSTKGGSYNITVLEYNNVDPSIAIFLKDVTTGVETDLSTTTIVSTVLARGSDINRFNVVFRQAAITSLQNQEEVANAWFATAQNDQLYISFKTNAPSWIGIQVADMMGRPYTTLNQGDGSGNVNIATSSYAKGVYLVKIAFANGKVETKKVVIE